MSDLSSEAQPAMEYLLQADPDELFKELGLRFEAIKRNPELAGSFELPTESTEEALGLAELGEGLRDFGHRFFERVNREAYSLVCGKESEQTQERKKLLDAFSLGPEAVAASLAALLVAQLGLAPAISAVVAAIVVKLFFKSAYGAMCEVWSAKLSPGS